MGPYIILYISTLLPVCELATGCDVTEGTDWCGLVPVVREFLHMHGFRERRSCKTQLIQLIEDLTRSLTQGKKTGLIPLDFSKAFDKVSHLKLLYKPQMHGGQDKVFSCIQSFLTGRNQGVVLEGGCSDEVPVSSGVPQGSFLGHILFFFFFFFFFFFYCILIKGLDKSGYQVNIFLISAQKHMLWVLIRSASARRFY